MNTDKQIEEMTEHELIENIRSIRKRVTQINLGNKQGVEKYRIMCRKKSQYEAELKKRDRNAL